MPLAAMLREVLTLYPRASASDGQADHPVARLLTTDLRLEIGGLVSSRYRVKGSAGQFGRWARCPWVAVMDQRVTTGASRGYYVVYLFGFGAEPAVHLSLNQATTEAAELTGSATAAQRLLEERATQYARTYAMDLAGGVVTGPLDLASEGHQLTRGYEVGNIAAYSYGEHLLAGASDQSLVDDLRRLLDTYDRMVADHDALGGPARSRTERRDASSGSPRSANRRRQSDRLPLEQVLTSSWTQRHGPHDTVASPAEARLLARFASRLRAAGLVVQRGIYVLDDGTRLYSDLVVDEIGLLVEAKSLVDRSALRMAVGQLLDYNRFEHAANLTILLPADPGSDLRAFVRGRGMSLVFQVEDRWRIVGPLREALASWSDSGLQRGQPTS